MSQHEILKKLVLGVFELHLPFEPDDVKEITTDKGCVFIEMKDNSLYQLHVRKVPTGPQ